VKVPIAFSNPDTLFGVFDRRIETSWRALLNLPPEDRRRRYALFSRHNNCCGIVTDALLWGGLANFAEPPSRLCYQDAPSLSQWVKKATRHIEAMNRAYQRFKFEVQPDMERTMPSYDKWKEVSNRGIGCLARRKEQIALIDGYLRAYHRYVQEDNLDAQLQALIMIQFHGFDHLARKARSDRHAGVVWLLGRVQNVMMDLYEEYAVAHPDYNFHEPPDPDSVVIEERRSSQERFEDIYI
jgi:hypothetical protein